MFQKETREREGERNSWPKRGSSYPRLVIFQRFAYQPGHPLSVNLSAISFCFSHLVISTHCSYQLTVQLSSLSETLQEGWRAGKLHLRTQGSYPQIPSSPSLWPQRPKELFGCGRHEWEAGEGQF